MKKETEGAGFTEQRLVSQANPQARHQDDHHQQQLEQVAVRTPVCMVGTCGCGGCEKERGQGWLDMGEASLSFLAFAQEHTKGWLPMPMAIMQALQSQPVPGSRRLTIVFLHPHHTGSANKPAGTISTTPSLRHLPARVH